MMHVCENSYREKHVPCEKCVFKKVNDKTQRNPLLQVTNITSHWVHGTHYD